jgi:hypothetical protein
MLLGRVNYLASFVADGFVGITISGGNKYVMFNRRRRGVLKQALDRARDPELQELRAMLTARQDQVAQLELELSDTRAQLSRFECELENRLGSLQRRRDELESQLADEHRRAAHRAQWRNSDETPDLAEDVVEQFRRTWTRKEKPPEPAPAQQVDEEMLEELKVFFRKLAKRFHPDLTTDPDEKRKRARTMVKVNAAYAAQDLAALQALAEIPLEAEALPSKTREQLVAELGVEIRRLDGVILDLRHTLQQLTNSHLVRLMLDATMAKRAGRDMLADMAVDLKVEIARLEAELAAIG